MLKLLIKHVPLARFRKSGLPSLKRLSTSPWNRAAPWVELLSFVKLVPKWEHLPGKCLNARAKMQGWDDGMVTFVYICYFGDLEIYFGDPEFTRLSTQLQDDASVFKR